MKDFCDFEIKHNEKSINFISKLNKDGRLIIPKEHYNNIKDGAVSVRVRPLRSLRIPKKHFARSKLDILSLVPKKTSSGFDILSLEENRNLFLWYFASKGRPNPIRVRRYLDLEFCRFLGYYRAEGGKARISYRRGREFSFTNTSLDIIQDFIRIFKNFTSLDLIKVSITYNPNKKVNLNKISDDLTKIGIGHHSIRFRKSDKVHEYSIRLYITNSLLSELVDNSEKIIRKELVSSARLKAVKEYLSGIIAGDGSVYFWIDKKGSLHSRLQIFEPNKSAIEDFNKMLKLFEINGRIVKAKSNMYIYTAFLNWKSLLNFFDNNLCPIKIEPIKTAIKKHKRFKTVRHLLYLPNLFTIEDVMRVTKRDRNYCNTWLRDRKLEGLIKIDQNRLRLTDSGMNLVKIIKKL
jgi:hypothetical protein